MGYLIDEKHTLMGFMDGPGGDPLIRGGSEFFMASVRVVPDIA